MFSFLSSPYHKDKEAFGSKAFNIAKLGAVVSAGVMARPFLHSFGGAAAERAVVAAAESIQSLTGHVRVLATKDPDAKIRGLGMTRGRLAGNLSKFFGFADQSWEPSFERLGFSKEHYKKLHTGMGFMESISDTAAGDIVAGSTQIRKTIASKVTAERRIDAFFKGLQPYLNQTKVTGADRLAISKRLGLVGRSRGAADFSKLQNTESMEALQGLLTERGYSFNKKFNFDTYTKILRENVAPIETSVDDIADVLKVSGNRETIADALVQHARRKNKAIRRTTKTLFPHSREVTIGQIQDAVESQGQSSLEAKQLYEGLKKHFTDRGFESTFLDTQGNEVDGLKQAFKDMYKSVSDTVRLGDKGTGSKELFNNVQAAIRESHSGFVLTSDGKLVNLNEQRKLLQKSFEFVTSSKGLGFQLPIFPGLMDVPANIFRFIKPDPRVVKNLGMLAEQPELLRLPGLRSLIEDDPTTHAISIGNRLLTLSGGEIINHGDKFNVSSFRRQGPNTSKIIRDLADSRLIDAEKYTIKDALNFTSDQDSTWWQETVSMKFGDAFNIHYLGPNNFGVEPKNPVAHLLAKNRFGRLGGIPIEQLPPTELYALLKKDNLWATLAENDPATLNHALRYITAQAGSSPNSIADIFKQPILQKQALNTPEAIWDYLGTSVSNASTPGLPFLQALIDNLDNPTALDEILNRSRAPYNLLGGMEDTNTYKTLTKFSDRRGYSTLHDNIQPRLYKALNTLFENPESAADFTSIEDGVIGNFKDTWFGRSNVSRSISKLEEGLLGEKMAQTSLGNLGGVSQVTDFFREIDANWSSRQLQDHLNNYKPFAPKLIQRLKELDIQLPELTTMRGNIFREGFDGEEVSKRRLGELAIALDTHEQLLEASAGNLPARGKIIDQFYEAVESIGFQDEKRGLLLMGMAEDADLMGVLQDRFRAGHSWRPQPPKLDPLNSSSWYTIANTSTMDFLDKSLSENFSIGLKNGFGIGKFVRGLTDVNQDLGYGALITQVLAQMPQGIAEKVGLGLNTKDRATVLRTVASFYGKRILPMIGAHLAYKQTNESLHDFGLPGFDDIGANVVANTNLLGARVKDFIGLTDINKGIVDFVPGLDQWFSPRSEEEYREHLYYGEEEVREGRLWFFGSRSPAMGDRIKYVRPSFYRRWKSRWTEDDYSDTYDPDNPYNKQNKSRRRLLDAGPSLTINSGGQYGATSIGSFGMGLPTTLEGGGYQMSFGSYHGGGGGGRGGGRGVGQTRGLGGIPGTEGGVGGYVLGSEIPYNAQVGSPINIGFSRGFVDPGSFNVADFVTAPVHALRKMSGLYGSFIQRFPLYPEDGSGFAVQDPNEQLSWKRTMFLGEYGELGTLNFGEFFRRFTDGASQALDAPSNLVNNMPSWLPQRFSSGNPYLRTEGIGELNLPSDAYLRANPWSTPLRVRGSSLGLSEEELIRKWLNPMEPLEGDDADDIVSFGSHVHSQIQRQMREYGILVAAETSIFDEKHNISGTIDAIVRGVNGDAVMDIKTQGSKSWGTTPEKYIDQITAYMAITGIKQGHLVFVNRDNPNQIRVENYQFSPARWEQILNRIYRARTAVGEMVNSGQISPFETYDLLSRIDILSKVAPGSAEFRRAVQFAEESGGFGGFEKQRFEQAKIRAKRLQEQHRTYPYRYNVRTEVQNLFVEDIGPNGEIITEYGAVKLAGVKFDAQAFIYQDPVEVMASFGIEVGKSYDMTFIEGGFNQDTISDTPLDVIIGKTNRKLIRSTYAGFDSESKNPLAYRVKYGTGAGLGGALMEKILHSDNIISNKFLRVRSPLEQFQRGEVFGIDNADWSRPWDTIIEPTISSMAAKNPITATIQTAFIGSLFFGTKLGKKVGAAVGAGIGLTTSLATKVYGLLTGKTWTPKHYNKQAEFDEYWDTLKFVKYTTLAEAAKRKAKKEEGTDIDSYLESEERTKVALGSWGTLAVWAERKARQTMYGFDSKNGSLQSALAAIPSRHRQIAEEIILSGSLTEKRKFYNLLSNAEKRVLGKFLNADRVPDRPDLSNYFKQHYLPAADWQGWDPKVNDDDLRTRAAAMEDVLIEKPSRSRYARARAYTMDVPIPKMSRGTQTWINARINSIIRDGGIRGIKAEAVFIPSDYNSVNVDMDVFEDDAGKLMEQVRREVY